MNQQKPGGVFDAPPKRGEVTTKPNSQQTNQPVQESAPPPQKPKEDFQTPFQQNEQMLKDRQMSEATKKKPSYAEQAANAINSAAGGGQADLTDEYNDAMEISQEDLALAEELVFKGYAETDVPMPNFPNKVFTICSTNAEELNILEEVIFDLVKQNEDKDGRIDMPNTHLQSWRNSLYVALSYRGMNQEELCSTVPAQHLNTIKKAISKVTDLYMAGEIAKADELKSQLKDKLKLRAIAVQRLGTPIIDFLSGQKAEFDQKMTYIMSTKDIVPKS